ncbi:MAG TPA: hypothetical protein VF817_01355 [Patescibacteria group bacterium]
MKKAFRIRGFYVDKKNGIGPWPCTFTVAVPSKEWAFRFLEQHPEVESFTENFVKEGFVPDEKPMFSYYF